ncbi:response regulator [Candidatus Sumerlaeota bacterium]|nr:response regulator [Candidatus Sumerlaeota bacterium]
MKWRILVVDDEPDVRLIIRTALEPKYEVLEAHDGLDALEKINRFEPDFALMDVMMPLMNGFEACAAIRKSEKYHSLPVMFLSALGSREDIKKGYATGANLYLTKPFDTKRLVKNIDVFFEQTPPPARKKYLSIEQLHDAEKSGAHPVAPGSHEYEVPVAANTQGSGSTAEIRPPSQENIASSQEGLLPRAMVVDDHPEIYQLIKLSLEGRCETVYAKDGMEAIEKLVKYQPDILIIDVMIPKMNGYQLVQSLRSNRAFARLPILMCSAKGTERDINFAKRIGANDYLVKPFEPQQIVDKIASIQTLAGYRVRPKTFSIQQVEALESPSKDKDHFQAGDDGRAFGEADKSRVALQKFINTEGSKEGVEKEVGEDKKKRRFFGFGSR